MSVRRFWSRGLEAYKDGRVGRALYRRLRPRLMGGGYLLRNPAAGRVRLHAPPYVQPNASEREIVGRIFAAFKKMKADQIQAPTEFLPASIWQDQLDDAFAHLITGARENDVERFHFFLANFGAWEKYHGVEHTTLIKDASRSPLSRRYVENQVFLKQLRIWEWFYGSRKPIDTLTYPMHGNQSGAFIDGVFVGVASFFTEIYTSLLAGLVREIERPVIAELGGGYGRWAHFILRDKPAFAYIDFDLPETLCLAAYYLMLGHPGKRVLLYGEEDYSPAAHGRYDLIFMPSYEIVKLGARSVDLFINIASLGEMSRASVVRYVGAISTAVRRWWFHMNHDVTPNRYRDDERGLLGHEYPVPDADFRLLFRYPDLGSMLALGYIDFGIDIFAYLYERRDQAADGWAPAISSEPDALARAAPARAAGAPHD